MGDMMRGLTKKQKKILKSWYLKHKDEVGLSFRIEDCNDFDILEELEEINDYETIIQDINNFLSYLSIQDLISEEEGKRRTEIQEG